MATVNGTNADDTLYGTSAVDSIYGSGGNDTLVGFAGADHLDGGSGIDSAFYFDSSAGVGVNLATGEGVGGSAEGDTLVSIEHLWGSSYNDTLTGNDGDNDLYGLDGNDVLKGGGGADRLDGGSGDDILKGGGGADVLVGGDGNDTADYSQSPSGISASLHPDHWPGHGVGGDAQYDTYSSIENLTGTAYEDHVTGNDDANVLRGLDGNDSLRGEGGNDTLDGGNGDDQLTGGMGDDLLRGGAGADELNGGGGPVTIEGSDTADYSEKTEDVSVTLNSNIVVDVFVGGVAEDTMRNIENVIGGSGNDIFVGDYLGNVLNGGAGNDRLDGGGGADTLVGGAGDDIFTVDNVGDQVIELAGEGADQVRSSVSLTLGANIENLTLTGTSAINGTGNNLENLIIGNGAANVLNGGGGADTMRGGAGDDTYIVNNVSDKAIEGISAGTDLVRSSVSFTLGANVENLTLVGASAINGTGNALANILRGNTGANVLKGGAGDDKVYGGAGTDTLNGGTGNDWLEGGAQRDVFIGGDGADSFVFRDGDFAGLTAATSDRISDFSQAQGDKIRLNLVDANTLLDGDQAFQFIGTNGFSNTAGELRYQEINGNTYVYGDTNGDGVADFMIQLIGSHALTGGDFVI